MIAAHERLAATHALPGLVAAIPVLTTARLVLRAPRLDDFPLLVVIDESVKETSLRERGRRETSWQDLMQMTATWVLRGHGWWTVEANGAAAGFVGLGFEPGDREPELGYLLAPEARGKGYATEAATAARDCARDMLKLPSLVSYIYEKNVASQNVSGKLGAARDAVAEAALGEDGVQVWRHFGAGEA